ncbi:MAG: metalloregulator ArsR/SmtB family transcription factor [Methanothermobacter thermautotrophicus]|nr:metalloregulator ArsR/SmtB family transcription factor [Methanothermobacter thermautotrophicus]
MKRDICEIEHTDRERVLRVRAEMPSIDEIRGICDIFKILSEPTRLKILRALSLESLCVCELASLLDVTQSAVSHQLRILRNAGMVDYERDGKMARYYLRDNMVVDFIEQCSKLHSRCEE